MIYPHTDYDYVDTLLHELAHHVTYHYNKKHGISETHHGNNWKYWAEKLGAVPRASTGGGRCNLSDAL